MQRGPYKTKAFYGQASSKKTRKAALAAARAQPLSSKMLLRVVVPNKAVRPLHWGGGAFLSSRNRSPWQGCFALSKHCHQESPRSSEGQKQPSILTYCSTLNTLCRTVLHSSGSWSSFLVCWCGRVGSVLVLLGANILGVLLSCSRVLVFVVLFGWVRCLGLCSGKPALKTGWANCFMLFGSCLPDITGH